MCSPAALRFLLHGIIALLLSFSSVVEGVLSSGVPALSQLSYTPVGFGVGLTPIIDGLQTYSGNNVTLNTQSPVLTLDYGAEVAGFPYFEVASLAEPAVQLELKYSEQFGGLNLSTGDGPWCLYPRLRAIWYRLI